MGMGEPLANYRNVLPVLELLVSDRAYGLSWRRVTVSTSGIVPHIDKLGEDCNVALAVSLHAPNDELRNRIVPINKLHPIDDLLSACWDYAAQHTNRFITFEYVMLKGVNDSDALAANQAEITNALETINRIANNTQFGTKKLLDGTMSQSTISDSHINSFNPTNIDVGTYDITTTATGSGAEATASGSVSGSCVPAPSWQPARSAIPTTAKIGEKRANAAIPCPF